MNNSALMCSNPAIGAHPKTSLGDLQGSGLAGNGYVHHYSDIPATTNLEMANGPPVKSWKSLVSMPVSMESLLPNLQQRR